jgi:alpha-amylase/alpha-mannosidase (GH57 family)
VIYWAPLFHFYQPPTQTGEILRKVTLESYRPLLEVLKSVPSARATLNINASLTEMLDDAGYDDVIEGMRQLARSGRVEFTGSGIYHPILPLIPPDEMDRQIRRNHQVNREILGELYQPRGFFPPEMAYSSDIVEAVSGQRHEWVIISGVACPVAWPTDIIHEVRREGEALAVFFRDDILSNKISFKETTAVEFMKYLRGLSNNGRDSYVVTAMDAETFGHHIRNWEEVFLAEVYRAIDGLSQVGRKTHVESGQAAYSGAALEGKSSGVRSVTVSELLNVFPRGTEIEPMPSSWSTSIDDIRQGNYFPLWHDKGNEIHGLLWDHLDVAIDIARRAVREVRNSEGVKYSALSRTLLDKALHSDQFWWASKKPMWDINMIYRGLCLQQSVLLNAYKAIAISPEASDSKKDAYHKILMARGLSERVMELLWSEA